MLTTLIKLSDLIPPKFHDVWRAAVDDGILHVVCKGGRGSGKSSDISHIIVQLVMRYAVNGVCIRLLRIPMIPVYFVSNLLYS